MANIQIRREPGHAPSRASASQWEPSRFARDFLGWDPFRAISPFNPRTASGFMPAFEVKETTDGYLFKADVPGVKDSDLEITMTGNRLTISGKRDAEREEETDAYYTYERSYGDFSRSFTLPDGVDAGNIKADLSDGVLAVTVKKIPQPEPRKIAVQTPSSPKKS
jgi:HSP20 family protein